MAVAFQNTTGPTWLGLGAIKNLVVFGDSYSSVRIRARRPLVPDAENRLGIPFPGYMWNEEDKPNWIGHLLSKPGVNPDMLVYDYAVGGHDVGDVRAQVEAEFIPQLGSSEGDKWTKTDTLFVIWVGINDCGGYGDIKDAQDMLLNVQNTLYDKGARNFLLIDVPPIDRSPALRGRDHSHHNIYSRWNVGLQERVRMFAARNPDATIIQFSSYDLFTRLLDSPTQYGFDEATAHVAEGCIWYDRLHPTSQVHDLIATEVAQLLSSHAPYNPLADGGSG